VKGAAYFLDRTARKPKVRLDIMAVEKPIQLNERSEADAMPTPACNNDFVVSKKHCDDRGQAQMHSTYNLRICEGGVGWGVGWGVVPKSAT